MFLFNKSLFYIFLKIQTKGYLTSTTAGYVDPHTTAYPYLTYIGMGVSLLFALITAYRMKRMQRNLRVIFYFLTEKNPLYFK